MSQNFPLIDNVRVHRENPKYFEYTPKSKSVKRRNYHVKQVKDH